MTNESTSITSWLNAAGRVKGSKEETLELCLRLKDLKPESRTYLQAVNRVCELNLLLVANVVRTFVRKRAGMKWADGHVEDLLQQGYFGLRRAVEKFDSTKGYTFATYATPWIRQAVTRHCAVVERPVHIPENVQSQLFYISKHGHKKPGSQSMTTNEDLLTAGRYAMFPVRLDAPVNSTDGETALHEVVPYVAPTPTPLDGEPTWASNYLEQKMEAAGLNETERQLLRFYSKRPRVLIAAKKCGMSETKARPILRGAIKRLEQLG